jgi:glycosyltransferase involved in cell wall biosynthesis
MHRVDQFHSGTAVGDAVTQQMFFLRDQLRSLGWQSEIYAQHIAPALADEIRDVGLYRPSPADLLLVHHSMGHTAFDRVIAANVRIVTVFHSITPARFFDDAGLRYHVRLGLQQLRVLARRSLFGVAVSNHNRREMLDAGFADVVVLPVRTDFTHARAARARRRRPSTDWLFVGRIAPNKRQVDIVRAFAAYSRSYDPAARLTLVGDTSMPDVADEVLAEADRLQVSQKVVLTGKVDEDTLWDVYSRSGLLVCLSRHEGFGVPVLEAMASGLPVIALREAAIRRRWVGRGSF